LHSWVCNWCREKNEGAEPCTKCGTHFGCKSPTEHLTPGRVRYAPKIAEIRKWSKKANQNETVTTIGSAILADIRMEAKNRLIEKPRIKYAPENERHLLEIAPVDLHVGKYAWAEEAGSDYDITIAEKVYTSAITDILNRASLYTLELIALIVGNDLLQTDNLAGTTTAGTYVDTDSRYIKSFRRARAINSWAIRECAKVAPVKVIVVPGNHDSLTAFHIGEVLEAEFDADPRVEIDNAPKRRKYLRYGKTLLGWTHGNEEKHTDLPLIMAQECPEEWALTEHREFHTGHLHKMRETRFTAGDSFNGVRVRVIPSLCAPDAWHYMKGFVKERRACEAYLWNYETAYAGHLSSNVEEAA
jgi:hypothetical protein